LHSVVFRNLWFEKYVSNFCSKIDLISRTHATMKLKFQTVRVVKILNE